MKKFDIREWIDEDLHQRPFRQAVHTILTAISGNPNLQTNMIMKGGILLALCYHSTRFTKDIDFSTSTKPEDFKAKPFREHFERSLLNSVEQLDYGLDCLVQSWHQKPPGKDKSFPTIEIKVGYAEKSNSNAHKRLMTKMSSQVVRVDYSLNEPSGDIELFEVDEGQTIQTYSYHDLVAEKFRALLQQEKRHRIRPQDVFDLNFLIRDHPQSKTPLTKKRILESLKKKAAARDLKVDNESMRNPEIVRRSEEAYLSLESQIDGALSPFEDVYAGTQAYYEDLPWNS